MVFGLSGKHKPRKVINLRSSSKLASVPDGKWKHAVTHVPRVYAFGHGNTSSRTPLIILVFGEFGTSAPSFVDFCRHSIADSEDCQIMPNKVKQFMHGKKE